MKQEVLKIKYLTLITSEINKAVLIGFLFVMVFASYGFSIFIISTYKKIIFKLAN